MLSAEEIFLEKLEKLDKEINEEEKGLTYLQKQVGHKIQKISNLKTERTKLSQAYKDLVGSVVNGRRA